MGGAGVLVAGVARSYSRQAGGKFVGASQIDAGRGQDRADCGSVAILFAGIPRTRDI